MPKDVSFIQEYKLPTFGGWCPRFHTGAELFAYLYCKERMQRGSSSLREQAGAK